MDVKCERCNTEYEFDDALVSGRGTTVKCTNCGHKFKIRRGDGDLADDYWNVTTGDGRTLVFTSLRELQRAIQGYLVERNDRLARGGLSPKPIGQIPELAPFFEQREATKKNAAGQNQLQRTGKTQDGIGPGGGKGPSQPPPMRPRQITRGEFPGPPPLSEPDDGQGKNTLIGTGPLSDQEAIPRPGPAAGPPRVGAGKSVPPPVPARGREPMATQPMKRPSLPSAAPPPPPPVPTAASQSSAPKPPPPPVPVAKSAPPPVPSVAPAAERPPQVVLRSNPPPPPAPKKTSIPPPVPARTRSLLSEIEAERDRRPGYDSIPEINAAPRRRPVGGFIVAVVVVGGLMTMVAVWAQKNLGAFGAKPVPTAPAADPRVAGFLVNGEKALADGNLDLAKESFDKASALAEKDPHVLLALARLAAVRADVPWLKQRLLAADATDDQKLAKNDVAELSAAARKAADDALAVAPEDPAAIRSKIDALRIAGDREGARALVPKISASASQPETAYVLAALDLAEAEPLWSTLIERLKIASSVETGPGRGRAALIYALARSGDIAGAKAEVERLSALGRPHPLLSLLRSFADKARPVAGKDAGAEAGAVLTIEKPGTKPSPGTASSGDGIPGDPRQILLAAEKARGKGDYEKARTLYGAALEKNPNDSEAMNGLAAIAYAQHDLEAARSSYKRVLAINPNYMPALVGLADVEWDSGQKDSATKMYKEIIDRFPEGSYPARAKQRGEGGG